MSVVPSKDCYLLYGILFLIIMKTKSIWFLALVAAMGGFLFGYDTAVINGAEQDIQRVFNLSATYHGLVMSSAIWGTVIGALLGGRIADNIGRKKTLLYVGLLYLVSAVWSGLASGPVSLFIARIIGGLGVGCSSVVAPVYIAEISPAEKRGLMTAIFQLDVVTGMCASQFVNMAISKIGGEAWRWMLGAEAVPAFLFFVLCFFIIESPRWLSEKNNKVVRTDAGSSFNSFWNKDNRRPILLAIFIALFNQLSGVNAIIYFMPRIFNMAGFSEHISMLLTAMNSVFFVVGTIIGMNLIDRLGRKKLLVIGGSGYVVSLLVLALTFHFSIGWASTVCIVIFMLSHAIGQGTVIWVIISEIFPTSVRGKGQSVGAFTHWTMSAIITLLFPIAAELLSAEVIFGTFGVFMIVHLLWAIFIVPETKGMPLEDLSDMMKYGRHYIDMRNSASDISE